MRSLHLDGTHLGGAAAGPESLPLPARLALLLAVCAAGWAVVLGVGYGAAHLL
jgi:hypothetical protein